VDIASYSGIGPIKLGMSPEEARAAVGQPYRSVTRSGKLTDQFPSIGVLVHYGASGRAEAVEVGERGVATFRAKQLLGQPYSDLMVWFKNLDANLQENDTGFTSTALGIGVYAPHARKDREAPVEGVIVFEQGYYSRK